MFCKKNQLLLSIKEHILGRNHFSVMVVTRVLHSNQIILVIRLNILDRIHLSVVTVARILHNGYIEIASQCMYFDDLQDQIMCKTLVTLITLEWLVLSLYSLMFYRFWLFLKTLGTIGTLKWLLPSMCPLVSFRFTIKIKILAIGIARICFKTTLYLLNDIGISDTYVSN